MATKIFPTVNDINGGTAGQGKTLTEANLKQLVALPYFDMEYVKSGASGSNGGGLILSVASGHYMIGGYWVYKDASENVTLTASSTNRVWLQLAVDGSGNVNGTNWVVRTDGAAPSGQPAAMVSQVVTGASTITTITDTIRGIAAPGQLIASGVRAAASASDTLGTSYGNYMPTSSVVVQPGASYKISGHINVTNAASGGVRVVNCQPVHGSTLADTAFPHRTDVPAVPASDSYLPLPFEALYQPAASVSGAFQLQALCTTAGAVVAKGGRLIVERVA